MSILDVLLGLILFLLTVTPWLWVGLIFIIVGFLVLYRVTIGPWR